MKKLVIFAIGIGSFLLIPQSFAALPDWVFSNRTEASRFQAPSQAKNWTQNYKSEQQAERSKQRLESPRAFMQRNRMLRKRAQESQAQNQLNHSSEASETYKQNDYSQGYQEAPPAHDEAPNNKEEKLKYLKQMLEKQLKQLNQIEQNTIKAHKRNLEKINKKRTQVKDKLAQVNAGNVPTNDYSDDELYLESPPETGAYPSQTPGSNRFKSKTGAKRFLKNQRSNVKKSVNNGRQTRKTKARRSKASLKKSRNDRWQEYLRKRNR